MFGPIFWKLEHGDPLILFHFLTAGAMNIRFWQKNWHILFDPKLSLATLSNLASLCSDRPHDQPQMTVKKDRGFIGPPGFVMLIRYPVQIWVDENTSLCPFPWTEAEEKLLCD